MARSAPAYSAQSSATFGFEAKLWLAADKLRNNLDAAEYKHVVLGLITSNTSPTPSKSSHAGDNRALNAHTEILHFDKIVVDA